MARFITIALGILMLAAGMNARSRTVDVPIDFTQVNWSLAGTTISLDGLLMVAGVVFILGGLVMSRLNTFD